MMQIWHFKYRCVTTHYFHRKQGTMEGSGVQNVKTKEGAV